MIYKQLTGELLDSNNNVLGKGYAGKDKGKNNPDMQQVKGIGPLPRGKYTIGKPYDSPHTGVFTIPLTPDIDNEMFGRDEFKIHGDNLNDPGNASEGCIIQTRKVRDIVASSIDKILTVI